VLDLAVGKYVYDEVHRSGNLHVVPASSTTCAAMVERLERPARVRPRAGDRSPDTMPRTTALRSRATSELIQDVALILAGTTPEWP
jgi:hypothetical protein